MEKKDKKIKKAFGDDLKVDVAKGELEKDKFNVKDYGTIENGEVNKTKEGEKKEDIEIE